MGGPGSTRWGQHVRRRTVNEVTAFVARTLARELRLPAVVGARTVEVERGSLRGKLVRYVIDLEAVAQPQGRGAVRWWCRCGECGVLRRALYARPDESRVSCRECRNLAYQSQRLARYQRLTYRAQCIARTLGALDRWPAAVLRAAAEATGAAEPDIVDVEMVADGVIPKRPRGMHRRTYRQRRAALQRVLDARDEIMAEDFADLLAGIGSTRSARQ